MKNPTLFSVFRPLALAAFISFGLVSAPAMAQKLKTKTETTSKTVYDAVQQPAQPIGGLEAYANYLSNNLVYPTASLRQGIEGTVEVSFIVEKTGVVSNATIIKGLDEATNQEALRVVQKGPRWEPARHMGQIVRQRVTLPVQYKIPAGATKNTATEQAKPVSPSDDLTIKTVIPEQPARPEGGTDAFFKYVQEKQQYPAKARRNNIQGKVMVEFIVEKDGSLTNMKVLKKFGNGLDEEAIRLVEQGPKWLPATVNGEPVRQKMVLPVIFQL
ncbi:MAG TPA: energy transducer TonB [Adhaeribacter sp.]|nr:energy transducer TonB [Adhaeribacter sp.]